MLITPPITWALVSPAHPNGQRLIVMSGIGRTQEHVQSLLHHHLVENRKQFLLKVALKLGLQLHDFRLRVLFETLLLQRLPLDVLFELRAGGVIHKRATLLQLALVVLQHLGLRRRLGLLLGDERLNLGR